MKNFKRETGGRTLVTVCGLFLIVLTLVIGVFLIVRGSGTFIQFHHSLTEFLFSTDFNPTDTEGVSGGTVGSAIFLLGTLETCGLALLIAVPFSIASAIFITEISPESGEKIFQPAIEIFVGIPSVVYGWLGMTTLIPFIRTAFNAPDSGYSVLAAGIVLSIMIFPTITTVSADAIRSVPQSYRAASYGLGSTRWQMIWHVVLPAALPGMLTGVILGLTRAFGEALAVSMVLGNAGKAATGILSSTASLRTKIAAQMGDTAAGGEYNMALWTMGLVLFIMSIISILLIHLISYRSKKKSGVTD